MSSGRRWLFAIGFLLMFILSPVIADLAVTPQPTRVPILPQVLMTEAPATGSIESVSSARSNNAGLYEEYPVWPDGAAYDLRYAPGQVLVRFDQTKTGSGQSVATMADSINAGIGARMLHDYGVYGVPGLELVSLPDNTTVQKAISYYQSTPAVMYAEPDFISTIQRTPDDPDFWRQYGLSNTGSIYKEATPPGIPGADIHAPGGWDVVTGTNGSVIAVVDTGVDIGHPDLAGNLWTTSRDSYQLHGYNVLEGESVEPFDDNSHGTHCAGIIGMVGNNGIGGTGVAWNTSIMAIKALNSMGTGKISDLVLGMGYASMNHVPVISCSFGNPYIPSRAMGDLIAGSPSLFVCAAGNSATDTTFEVPEYPACFNETNVIAVASTDASDHLSEFSNYGNQTIQVAAPGSLIYSTLLSEYSWDYLWKDSSLSPDNFTFSGNWKIEPAEVPGGSPSLHGTISRGDNNASLVLETVIPVNVTAAYPSLVWGWKGQVVGSMRTEVSRDGINWAILQDYMGDVQANTWTGHSILCNSVLGGERIRLRVTIRAPDADSSVDIYLHDIGIGYRSLVTTPGYGYLNGTSMATPMVAGVAGLLKGADPGLTAADLREVIMNSVDPLPFLQGKIVTGGRVNLTRALAMVAPSQAIQVKAGWNHVSVPRHLQPGADTASIFAGVDSAGHSVLAYLDDLRGWKTLNSSDPILPLSGYWLFSTNATSVPVRFASPVVGPVRQVGAGWSSVGSWSDEPVTADATLSSLGTGWSYLIGYDALSQRYEEVIIRGGTGNQSDLRPVQPYQGYWLYCSRNGTYQGPVT